MGNVTTTFVRMCADTMYTEYKYIYQDSNVFFFVDTMKTDLYVLVCASLTTRVQHHVCAADEFRLHHVPGNVTKFLLQALREEDEEVNRTKLLYQFFNDVKRVHGFIFICFWLDASNVSNGVDFLLLSNKAALCSYSAPSSMGPHRFEHILSTLPSLNQFGFCHYNDLVPMITLPSSVWRPSDPSITWIESFCDRTSFLDAAVSFGCPVDDSFEHWSSFAVQWSQDSKTQEMRASFDVVGYIGEMILGYVGFSVPWDWNGFQYSNNIVIPNYAMLSNTFKKSYLNVHNYRPRSYEHWLERKKMWCLDRVHRVYNKMHLDKVLLFPTEPASALDNTLASVYNN
jgi:hypothetical protein